MTPDTLVSVIIPASNCAPYLRLAVQSALDQDYSNKEVIVIDDGSTDNTAEVLSRFGSRISAISQQNAGIASARPYPRPELSDGKMEFRGQETRCSRGASAAGKIFVASGQFAARTE